MLLAALLFLPAADPGRAFFETHCMSCHDAGTKKGNLDLTALKPPTDPAAFPKWVKVHDRVRAGEMPPKKKLAADEVAEFLKPLDAELARIDRERTAKSRAVLRRLTRTEYEWTLRDLLHLPGLPVRDLLPDDGRAFGFDRVGSALDVSAVQLSKYLEAADFALKQATAQTLDAPIYYQKRLRPGENYDFLILLSNGDAVPLKDAQYDPVVGPPLAKNFGLNLGELIKAKKLPYAGTVGLFRHEDESFPGRFSNFAAVYSGLYRVRLSVWGFQWNKGAVERGTRTEIAALTANGRPLGMFDAPPMTPTVHEVEVWLNAGEYLQFNAASLWPVRVSERKGVAAEYVGPGIALDWLDVEGPVQSAWPPPSHRRLFGGLTLGPVPKAGGPVRVPPRQSGRDGRNSPGPTQPATVFTVNPVVDATKLLNDFLPRAFRRPVPADEAKRYVDLFAQRLTAGASFEDALHTAYTAALCGPEFLYLPAPVGPLNDFALAARLSYFLTATTPDDELLAVAAAGTLRDPTILRSQTERLLKSPKASRFVQDFLDQWLDLRDFDLTTPDRRLYPEYRPLVRESARREPREFFAEMVRRNWSVQNVVRSDRVIVNDPLAELYGLPGVTGSEFRTVTVGDSTGRGGLLSTSAVLKVTANGTTTSPVKRGAWVQRKIVGKPPDPPPPDIPAVEPDVRGTTTVRQLLAKHRDHAACASCHAVIDPPGFALEEFDPVGRKRSRFRVLGPGDRPAVPDGRNYEFSLGPKVDAAGTTAIGQPFADFNGFRKLLDADGRALARNFVVQLLTYATGAPPGYADRPAIEAILDRAAKPHYGVRDLIHAAVQSELFRGN